MIKLQIILPALAATLIFFCRTVSGADTVSPAPASPRARVVTVRNPSATEAFKPRAGLVEAMMNQAITNFTSQPNASAAWIKLAGTNDIIGIKVYTTPGPIIGTRVEVTAAVVKGLLAAGVATNRIIVWDRHEASLRQAGYFELVERFGIRVAGAAEAGYDERSFYETALLGNLIFGDLEFGSKEDGAGRKSFVSKLVTRDMTRIIVIAPVINHNSAGVAGCLFSLAMGSVDNIGRFDGNPVRLAEAVPDIYALPPLADRVVLNISDALVCQYQGEDKGLIHYSTALNEIRLSRDPVALDVLALQDLEAGRKARGQISFPVNWELYKNAALPGIDLGVAETNRIEVITLEAR